MVHCFHLYPHFVWLKSAPATKVLGASHIKAQYWGIEGVQAGPRRPRCAPLEFAARASVDPLSILTKFNFGGKQWIQGLNLKAWQPLSSLHHIDLSFLIWTTQTRQSLLATFQRQFLSPWFQIFSIISLIVDLSQPQNDSSWTISFSQLSITSNIQGKLMSLLFFLSISSSPAIFFVFAHPWLRKILEDCHNSSYKMIP